MIEHPFPVVGIGASAGGLEAMTALFDAKPALRGVACIIVQHLDPKGESHLVDLLSRHTSLTVRSAQDGLEIEPDHVYVCVPSRDLVVADGRLRLVDPEAERSLRHPIDRFFDSLGTAFGERAVAVILSGTASDGSRGIAAIKAAGGIVIAQDPTTAEFDGMPLSAVRTGLVDLVLPVDRMPETLLHLALRSQPRPPGAGPAAPVIVEPAQLHGILGLLRDRFGYDFSDYKRPTLLRRTQRRMSLRSIDDVDAYAALVRRDSGEAAALFRDLMINVSSFFRDPRAWEALDRDVIEPLVAKRESGEAIRIWSVGCATGEEAYTIGMLLSEHIEASGKSLTPQVFATDVSDSLSAARSGVYPEAIAAELSPERFRRFFTRHESSYEVKKHLRDMVVFARHNVISDPPFSRMDVICCRNMLIYIEPESQRRILWLFNFALRDGGALMLGSAETTGVQSDLFEPISAEWRLFRSRRVAHAGRFEFPRFSMVDKQRGVNAGGGSDRPSKDQYVAMAQRMLLDRYTPPSVVVDAAHQVLVYHGDTTPYLTQPGGEPTRDLLALVATGVRPPLRHAINEALREKRPAVAAVGYVKREGVRRAVMLTVSPLGTERGARPVLLVTFEEPTPSAAPDDHAGPTVGGGHGQTVDQLEEELRLTRQEARDVAEQYDRLVEEYGTSHEEMLSINEELQSANEELETSKEELQSLNEELNTLNNELRSKVEVVEQTNNDLNNLLASTEIATLFLDADCCVRWFTPAIKQVLRLIPSDIGRPIRDLASTVTGSDIDSESRLVLESLVPVETEVAADGDMWFIRRVLPYRTADDRIDGIVVTFVDITDHKKGQQQRDRLMHELSHRIKNTLATVQAIVLGVARQSGSVPEFLAAFEPRLAALARAQSILTHPGAEHVAMQAILERELEPYVGGEPRRVVIAGPALSVARESAIALGLVFHELVTNAAKYGSLSNDAGTVAVRWERAARSADDRVRVEWIESGGPRVEPRGRRGFGSLLIESSVTHDLAGSVTMEFDPDGLRVVMEFPVTGGADDGAEEWNDVRTWSER